jgi:hypothetical protein
MAVLNLRDGGTRAVLSQFGLKPAQRIGRGQFCAVYADTENNDVVVKLTADAIQLESVRDYLVGAHYPMLLHNEGYVGTQYCNDQNLYLFKTERLQPLRMADKATKKLANLVLKLEAEAWYSFETQRRANVRGSLATQQAMRSNAVLEQLLQCKELPASILEAFEALYYMHGNYNDLTLDFHSANLMVRGTDELVFNDVILDAALWYGSKKPH